MGSLHKTASNAGGSSKQADEVIGIGIVGYGHWGPNLVRNFFETPGCRVVSVCDLHPDRLAKVRARYPTIDTTADYRHVLADHRVDAVVVATPVSTHFELGMQALRTGRHVLIEKPLTADVEEALRLVDEAERRNLTLALDHTFVYTHAVRKIHDLLTLGDLGEIQYYDSVRVNLGPFKHDINVIWDLGVHDVAIMDYVLPARPVGVSASGLGHVAGEPENIGYVTFQFDSALIAHLHVNWLAPVETRRTTIGCSRKMIVYDDLEPSEKVKVYHRGITANGDARGDGIGRHAAPVGYRTGDVWAPQLDVTEALALETRDFVECLKQRRPPTVDGHAGLRVVRLLEAATRSMRAAGKVVELAGDGCTV